MSQGDLELTRVVARHAADAAARRQALAVRATTVLAVFLLAASVLVVLLR